jgi:heat shock protein HslJ
MTDEELARTIGIALRDRYPVPSAVDLLPRLRLDPGGRRWRGRAILAAAASVLIIAALGAVLAPHTSKTSPSAAASALTGVTWTDPASRSTVVFDEDSVRIDNGCEGGLRALTIGDDWLAIGEPIGMQSVCSPVSTWPPPDIAHFDRVLTAGRLTWVLTGDTLRLTNAKGESLDLRGGGPALAVTGQKWALERVLDDGSHGQQLLPGSSAAFMIDDGRVHASDLCSELSGSATVTDTTITFTDVQPDKACIDPGFTPATRVIDSVLSGTISYGIRGDELILYGEKGDLLTYTPAD